MGQKVSPVGLRVGVNRDWDSRWYANDQDFAGLLHEDIKVRDYILKKLKTASVAKVEIERSKNRVTIFVHTSRPGVVIGKDGEAVDALRKEVSKLVSSKQVFINIVEFKNPDVVAQLVANNIAEQLENRASFRTVQKRAIQRAMRAGAKGIKTNVSGRLGGADMARAEGYSEGNVPLHTLRADIDYATAEADTTYGKLGVKYRRPHRVSYEGRTKGGDKVSFGEFGLVATEGAWITSRQIEAARIAINRYMNRGGKVWIRIFPHLAKTKKPLEVRMGSGKGSPEEWVAVVKTGRVLFEVAGLDEATLREALRLASHKLPIKCKIIGKGE